MHFSPEDFTCPVCRRIDRVEKVSAVYAAGTTSGAYAGESVGVGAGAGGIMGMVAQTNLTGMTQTKLSKRLAPPSRPPALRQDSSINYIALLATIGVISGIFTLICLPMYRTSSEIIPVITYGAFLFFLCIVGIVGIVLVTRKPMHAKKIEHARQVARWQQATANWHQLYYCGRNDVVFFPGVPDSCVSADEMYNLL